MPTEPSAMPSKKKRNLIIAILVIAAVIIAAFGGYEYYKRTPEYTFHLIQTAVKNHDYDTFSKHVDTKQIATSAIDDYMKYYFKSIKLDPDENSLVTVLLKSVETSLVDNITTGTETYIKTGSFTTNADDAKKKEQGQIATAVTDQIGKKEQSAAFSGVKSTRKEGNFTIATIELTDSKLDHTFAIDLKMRQLSDGTWQIVQISNMNDLIQEEEKATKEKLAEINKPIQDEIDKEVQIGTVTLRVIPDIFSSTLDMSIPMTITSDKQISLIEGKLVNKKDDSQVVSDVKLRRYGTDTQCIGTASYDLNPFISSELEIIKNKASQIDPEFKITKITYADGSSLALKTEIE